MAANGSAPGGGEAAGSPPQTTLWDGVVFHKSILGNYEINFTEKGWITSLHLLTMPAVNTCFFSNDENLKRKTMNVCILSGHYFMKSEQSIPVCQANHSISDSIPRPYGFESKRPDKSALLSGFFEIPAIAAQHLVTPVNSQ
jgi:hypothetical protein